MSTRARQTPWLLCPFAALWRLVTFILAATGRIAAVVLGVTLMTAGALLCATIIGAVIGIPLLVGGFMLTIRGLF
jgi:hypothetical protein